MITRIFHPIGQGAFYSELHELDNGEMFNIIYDCGVVGRKGIISSSAKALLQGFAAQSQYKTIDILFISHLDYDHVSGITELLNNGVKFKRIILPLLYPNCGNSVLSIIQRVVQSVLKGTRLIYVSPESDERPSELTVEQLDDDKNTIIKSNTRICYARNSWVFVPYNYDYSNRNKVLMVNLKTNGFSVKSLIRSVRYISGNLKNPVRYKKLKDAYEKICNGKNGSGINENSMLVYSGPNTNNSLHVVQCSFSAFPKIVCFRQNNLPGCVYMGDSDMHVCDIKNIYNSFCAFIGCVQIPHHGSYKNYDSNSLKNFICPISAGNSSKHPSKNVVYNLIQNDCVPLVVTEDPTTEYIEEIKP
ncbi:MBL fold metallo-hydrolase [Fibrobacter sp. UWB7]|uniref:MBL fold metallo-hydrolase n=1 Tax=Fibrobacter sp. UWB7 TaxID=1896206 RepID=UPI00092335A5|nr:MBL fold metallo-hydrolase [Fibrobacter sp. UWB7]SHL96944.1 hypothetical protein SAMN05720467_0136 [Fibrobacter sp. UWB7]